MLLATHRMPQKTSLYVCTVYNVICGKKVQCQTARHGWTTLQFTLFDSDITVLNKYCSYCARNVQCRTQPTIECFVCIYKHKYYCNVTHIVCMRLKWIVLEIHSTSVRYTVTESTERHNTAFYPHTKSVNLPTQTRVHLAQQRCWICQFIRTPNKGSYIQVCMEKKIHWYAQWHICTEGDSCSFSLWFWIRH